MKGIWLRRSISVSLLGLGLWSAWAYGTISRQTPVPPALPAPPKSTGPAGYHAYDRAVLPSNGDPGYCSLCHGRMPHGRSSNRAFLNLHTGVLDCGVCHLTGREVGVRRFRDALVVTNETLATGSGGRLFAANKREGDWKVVVKPGDGVRLLAEGGPCDSCHRRGSPLLAAEGLYDPYRRRVLEDLSVLRWLEDAR